MAGVLVSVSTPSTAGPDSAPAGSVTSPPSAQEELAQLQQESGITPFRIDLDAGGPLAARDDPSRAGVADPDIVSRHLGGPESAPMRRIGQISPEGRQLFFRQAADQLRVQTILQGQAPTADGPQVLAQALADYVAPDASRPRPTTTAPGQTAVDSVAGYLLSRGFSPGQVDSYLSYPDSPAFGNVSKEDLARAILANWAAAAPEPVDASAPPASILESIVRDFGRSHFNAEDVPTSFPSP